MQFSILSPEEIRKGSVANIVSRDTYVNNKPVIGGLLTRVNNVVPHKMNITGFGPFIGPLTIALNGQGFTLVSGADSETSGSNGTGKSMITAGAMLWVCTGLLDGRCGMTFENGSSVIHSGHSFASVTLSGVSENKYFEITRTISAQPKKHTIEVKLDGENITRSTITATQRAIASDIFGLNVSGSELWNWLLRHCCWSQQSVVRFCNANDSQAKKEIQTLGIEDEFGGFIIMGQRRIQKN